MTFDDLRACARQLVSVLEEIEPELACIVIVATPPMPGTENLSRYACSSNVASGSAVARVCREVARSVEVS